jgi:regulator of cell morphogenesis and NO signaling
LFEEVAREFENHMMKEEVILFPRIKSMEGNQEDSSFRLSVKVPIQVMENEHVSAGDVMEKIRTLTDNYTAPETACMTHRLCLDELRMFETDLHQHVHLENNILFPKAIALEDRIASRTLEK